MRIFIFKDVEKLTDSYHTNGALVVVAENITKAIEIAHNHEEDSAWKTGSKNIKLTTEEIEKVVSYDLLGENIEPKLFLFPDSGCC